MAQESDWITLATTPPSDPNEFKRLTHALGEANIESEVEENLVRQCENDPAFWLRVRSRDLALAWDLARKLAVVISQD